MCNRKQIAELGLLKSGEKGAIEPESAYSLMRRSQQLATEHKNAALAEEGKTVTV